ncbi:glycosyltransferase family 2 protein [bacterium]|nr:glycosyltransferase family 2 protein [bacterium]
MSTDRVPVSVVIPVLNEERNIAACIASVAWADEIFVVDSGSRDKTVALADDLGAEVVSFRYEVGGPRKKNWSLDNLPFRHEWVLLVDADERITPELEEEIRALFDRGPTCRGYYLNRMHLFLGRWLRHGGNYPSWNLRLLRRDAGRYERLGTEDLQSAGDVEVHEHILLDGPAGYLNAPMLHEDFKDLSHFIDRHNRYSTWDARMREVLQSGTDRIDSIPSKFSGSPVERKRWLKKWWVHLPFKPLLRFLYMYVVQCGFLDGKAGFYYSAFKAVQEFHISAKIYEQSLRSDKDKTHPPQNANNGKC